MPGDGKGQRPLHAAETVPMTASRMRGLLEDDGNLAAAVAELRGKDYLTLDAASILSLLRFLVNDVMTVPSVEGKVSHDADEQAELKMEARRAAARLLDCKNLEHESHQRHQ